MWFVLKNKENLIEWKIDTKEKGFKRKKKAIELQP